MGRGGSWGGHEEATPSPFLPLRPLSAVSWHAPREAPRRTTAKALHAKYKAPRRIQGTASPVRGPDPYCLHNAIFIHPFSDVVSLSCLLSDVTSSSAVIVDHAPSRRRVRPGQPTKAVHPRAPSSAARLRMGRRGGGVAPPCRCARRSKRRGPEEAGLTRWAKRASPDGRRGPHPSLDGRPTGGLSYAQASKGKTRGRGKSIRERWAKKK